jgi:DnaK suppressor protein
MAYLRGKLLEKRRQLSHAVRWGISEPAQKAPPPPGDEYDAANESADTEIQYEIAQIEAARLDEVEHALRKLAKGNYGECERCGRRIPANRLNAMPFALLCVKCKEREEELSSAASAAAESSWARVEPRAEERAEREDVIEAISRTD